MTGQIPVTIADVSAKSVQHQVVLFRILLHRRREHRHSDSFTPAKLSDSIVWIEDVFGADALQKRLATRRRGQNLGRIAESHDGEYRALRFNLVSHRLY